MTTTNPDELAAPLDLLLISATRPFGRRMIPNASWARLGANLAKQPGAVAGRVGALTRELGGIAAGRSHRAPARADKRFADAAWEQNPLLHRIMQAYLAGSETAEDCSATLGSIGGTTRRCGSCSTMSWKAWRPATTRYSARWAGRR